MDDGLTDNIYQTGDIFSNRELVRVGYVPKLSRIVGRDDEVREVGGALGPAIQGGPPETCIIYGKTGTGKSLVARCVTRGAVKRAQDNGHSFQYCYVDCSDYQTEAKASREMARGLEEQLHADKSIPRIGIGAADYRDITWELLSEYDIDSFVVILDEIDKLENDEILRSVSRAKESGKSKTNIGVICISNKIEYRKRFSERVDSSLQENDLVFDPYDAHQLRNILTNRKDAFKEGVLEKSVIPKIAASSAQEHGDARKAVDTLYEAGRLAEKAGASTVTNDFVDEALKKAEANRFKELVSGQPPQVKLVLAALASLTKAQDRDQFRTSTVYDWYKRAAAEEGKQPLSYDRVSKLLREQGFLGITESEHTGGGYGEGSYMVHRLLRDPDIVVEALNDAS
ncbi:Cdc6/Cdc18 family protein [Halocatena pleomorpha]|uniref:ORC1-type DNA replication protein n=1 Tax=Halocatena pleomorpha TaxID=1785090 RepID=A0A3P3RAJ3_9EURY|nr:AAA family ATPase [Halocatena pleomorpha]RRJ29453.1 AAA family ATPase [Halocatena pleomorpha]